MTKKCGGWYPPDPCRRPKPCYKRKYRKPCYPPCDPCCNPYQPCDPCCNPCNPCDPCCNPCDPCCNPWCDCGWDPCRRPCPPKTNLAVTSAGPIVTSSNFTLTFTVVNQSKVVANNVQAVLTIPIANGFSLPSSVGLTQGSYTTTATSVAWNIGTLVANQLVTMTVVFPLPEVTSTGVFAFSASTSTPECNYQNNSTSLTVTINSVN